MQIAEVRCIQLQRIKNAVERDFEKKLWLYKLDGCGSTKQNGVTSTLSEVRMIGGNGLGEVSLRLRNIDFSLSDGTTE